MKAVAILCGGLGTRLGVEGQKCLADTAGRPFLHWKLDQLAENGATDFYLLVSHESSAVQRMVGDDWYGLPVSYIRDEGVGAWEAHDLAAPQMPFVHWLTYGDVLLDYPLRPSLYPYMVVTANSPVEPYNINGEFLDAGLYYCWGGSKRFLLKETPERTWQINTPDQLGALSENLRGYRVAVGDRGTR